LNLETGGRKEKDSLSQNPNLLELYRVWQTMYPDERREWLGEAKKLPQVRQLKWMYHLVSLTVVIAVLFYIPIPHDHKNLLLSGMTGYIIALHITAFKWYYRRFIAKTK